MSLMKPSRPNSIEKPIKNGVPVQQLDQLATHVLKVTQPDSPNNPWSSRHVKARNYLIILWLIVVGLRRGELAGLRIADFTNAGPGVGTVRISGGYAQMQRNRILAVNDTLMRLTFHYVLTERSVFPGAKEHDVLFVSERTGKPLSVASINRVFERLRRSKDLPGNLPSNWCRIAWNEDFYEHIDTMEQLSATVEEQLRSYLMGWKLSSGKAKTYLTRRASPPKSEGTDET